MLSVQNLIGPDVEVLTLTTAFPARTDAVDPPLPVVVPAGPSVNVVATTVIRNSRIPALPFTIVATITWGQVGGGAGGSVDLPILVSTLDTTLCDNPDLP